MEFVELPSEHYPEVYELFAPLEYSLSIRALLEGNNPGYIFVDDVNNPRTAFALTVEGYLLVGDHTNPETNAALRDLLRERIFSGEVYTNGDESMSLAVYPDAWEALLLELIPTHEIEKLPRYHYLCRALCFDWRSAIPEGYTVRRVDKTLRHDQSIDWSLVADWFDWEDCWFSEQDAFMKGVSFAVLHDQTVVAWCTPDCVAGKQLDVGIYTAPEHRRKGLAAIVTAATVDCAFAHSFEAVGWHCNADNIGSWKTAEKVGFVRQRDYAYYYYMYDPVDHLAELGYFNYKLGNYDKTVAYYAQVFEQRPDCHDYYFHLAALAWAQLGDAHQALRHLNLAVDHGWCYQEMTKSQHAFALLHTMPDWEAVLARMQQLEHKV